MPQPSGRATLAQRLAGKTLFLTGVTGFIGEALLERVLAELPDTKVIALVRPGGGQSAEQRAAGIRHRAAWGPLRTRIGEEALARIFAERVTVLPGDLTDLPALPAGIDVAIHCAGAVSFDPPLDEGFATNIGGSAAVLDALLASGSNPHLVQVSTAYVSAGRSGLVPEGPVHVDAHWRTETELAEKARLDTELGSRTPAVLGGLNAEAKASHGTQGTPAVAREAERLRLEWVRKQLVSAGTERARSLGATDCYTLTKALAEQMLLERHGPLPLSIVRPSIVESALALPYPGWIEGFKMAEPVLLAYGRGMLPDFPADPDVVLDVIPVDLVVSATLAVAASTPPVGEPAFYHLSSSAANPLSFSVLHDIVLDYFSANPLPERDRGHYYTQAWSFAGQRSTERRLATGHKLLDAADKVLDTLPASTWTRARVRTVDRQQRRLRALDRLTELYGAYAKAHLTYLDGNIRALSADLADSDQEVFATDPAGYDWQHYLAEVHLPSVTALLRWPVATKPEPAVPTPVPSSDDTRPLAVFDLDGTLLAATVIEAWLWLKLADSPGRRLGVLGQVLRHAPGIAAAEGTDRGEVVRRAAKRYAGAHPQRLAELVADTVGDELLARMSAAGLRQVRAHRAAGHRTVLLTGALEMLVAPLAPLFDEVVATRLQVGADGRCSGRLDGAPVVAEARAAWVRNRLTTTGAQAAASYAYADSASDLPMLQAVGHPVAVNPDAVLLRHARKLQWPVAEWPLVRGSARFALPATVPAARRDRIGAGR